MPGWWSDLTRTIPVPALFIAGAAILVIAGIVLSRKLRRPVPPDELEKRRRHFVHLNGKLGDGEIIDIDGAAIFYSYDVAGVNYTTSQDIGALGISLPSDRMAIIGPASVRFLPVNPANSIVVCEQWSGLRGGDQNHTQSG